MKPRLLPTFSVVFVATVLGVFLYRGVHEHTIPPAVNSQIVPAKRFSTLENTPPTTYVLDEHKDDKRDSKGDHTE